MFIRDVNNYIAVDIENKVKLKGAYWTPDISNYHKSISTSQPPAWHKNLSNLVSVRAAVANMTEGIDIETYIKTSLNPYDFLSSIKIKRSDSLFWGDIKVQKNTRYFISKEGFYLVKHSPPKGRIGTFKKANGISDFQYEKIMEETNWQWDGRVCTKNKSKYEKRETSIAAGHKVIVCNDIKAFDWSKVNYEWYIQEALKLII